MQLEAQVSELTDRVEESDELQAGSRYSNIIIIIKLFLLQTISREVRLTRVQTNVNA